MAGIVILFPLPVKRLVTCNRLRDLIISRVGYGS